MNEAVARPDTADVMTRRRLRLAGAAGVSVVTMVIAAVAHGLASGEWPGALAIAVALPFSILLGLPLLGRRVRSWRIALVVLIDQTVFHLIASTLCAAGDHTPAAATSPLHGHGSPIPLEAPTLSSVGAAVMPDAAMIAGHLATAAVSFALLRGGWALILRLLARGTALLLRRIVALTPAVVRTPRSVRMGPLDTTAHGSDVRAAVRRRGPPVPALLG